MTTEHKTTTDHDILEALDLTLAQVGKLKSKDRNRLLNFLLQWEQFEQLLACADVFIQKRPKLVSLRDYRIKALLGLKRPEEAFQGIQERIQLRDKVSMTARALLAHVYLELKDEAPAYQIALELVQESPTSATGWSLLGEVELARDDPEAALDAYRELDAQSRYQSRSYLLGMTNVYRALDDWVTASGYAVRVLRTVDADHPLTIPQLRALRDYFEASGDQNRFTDLETELNHRFQEDLDALRKHFAPRKHPHPVKSLPAAVATAVAPDEGLPTPDNIPVSAEERQTITAAARRLFGFETLLPGQLQTIAGVQRGESILTILPTGGGKSLCYQLPAALSEEGTTLVISPLIALMKDQVESLPAGLRQRAATINSSLDGDELHQRLRRTTSGHYRLVYAAPERLRQPPFMHALRRAGVTRLVVDEAHCVSMWGHSFRPDYLAIGQAHQALGSPPLLALTATAPPYVRHDIIKHLGHMRLVAGDVTRPNLQLEVFYARNKDEKLRRLLAFCKDQSGSGIIYAGTRARCETLTALLRRHNVDASYYHAGIPNRDEVQDDFMHNQVRVVVATIAFGLGIDKPDIRFIVHFVPPTSLEAYYQEAGRAGRDGLPARCLLMYASSDRSTLTRHVHQDELPIEFLRAVYGNVKGRLNQASMGKIALVDLARDLRADDVKVRVALSLLEEVELLRRGPDMPRAALIQIKDRRLEGNPDPSLDPKLRQFCNVARLSSDQWLMRDLLDVAQQIEIPAAEIEQNLLEWVDAGYLNYRASGRDMLIELLPPPKDAAKRVATLLENYEAVQLQRVDDIAAYAQNIRCRHGHLNAHLGGRPIEHCKACDNCITIDAPPKIALPTRQEQKLIILRCVAGASWNWGRRNLERILHGDKDAPPSTHTYPEFGALAFRSKTAIKHLLENLVETGWLKPKTLNHGGQVLEITPEGQTMLQKSSSKK